MPLFKPESMHQRPGWPIETKLRNKNEIRNELLSLAQKVEEIDLPDVSVECLPSPFLFHPTSTNQNTPPRYVATEQQRATMEQAGPPPSLFVTITVVRHEDIENARRKITGILQGTALTIRPRRFQTVQNDNEDAADEHTAIFEISYYYNRHRTIR